jgi:RND family efflux transporter MFP subunit
MPKTSFFRRLVPSIVVLGLIGAGIVFLVPWKTRSAPAVPTAEVKLGEFVGYVQLRGEIRARISTFIIAPFNAGDLQILKLTRDGTLVKKGDVIVQLDPTSLQRSSEQYRSTLRQTEAEIDRMKAQQRLGEEQSLTDKMRAEFDVERARLDASRGEVVPAIENEKSQLALGKAEQRVKEVDQKIASDRVGAEADLAANIRKRDKANADLERAQRNLAALTLVTPVDGLVMLQTNSRARTSVMGGGSAPIFKEGDRAWAGAVIAELPDLTSIEAHAPVEEADRGKLEPGQSVTLRVDALPDKELKGRAVAITTLARVDYSSYPYKKTFDLTIHLDRLDPRLRPGMSATTRIAFERLPSSILVPVEAIFEKNGRIVAYALAGGRFEERNVEIARRGEGQALVARGLKQGERVALKDPTLAEQK